MADRRHKEDIQWNCPICGCVSAIKQDICPNGCEAEELETVFDIEIVRRFHQAVQTFCEYHLHDDYDHCELCLTKEFDEMKKTFWEVKLKILERSE